VADRQAKEVDHFVDVRPDEMGAQDSAGILIDQCLKTVDRFIEPSGWYRRYLNSLLQG
jgi:hypothetical protein